jgi:hypothetical protein
VQKEICNLLKRLKVMKEEKQWENT